MDGDPGFISTFLHILYQSKGLSGRRAKSTLEYLVKNGVDRSRLTSQGLGESELVNKCSNGIPCSEAEHQRNRRSEFIVLE